MFFFHFLSALTNHMIKKAKALFNKDGILTSPSKKKGKPLNSETKALVKSFYSNDDVSRMMPGNKDFIRLSKMVFTPRAKKTCFM